MKRIILVVAALLCLSSPCFAQGVIYEQTIAVTSGTTYMVSVPDDVMTVLVQVTKGDPVRMAFGTLTVSSTVGVVIPLYSSYECRTRGEAVAARFTVASGSGSSIYVVGYGYR